MQLLCSLTSAISIIADTHVNGVKKPRALIKTPLARLLVERYEKRHLAAQVRSANGLRGIFKFSEILGRPTYTNGNSCEHYPQASATCVLLEHRHGPAPWRKSRTAQHFTEFRIMPEDAFYQCVHSLSHSTQHRKAVFWANASLGDFVVVRTPTYTNTAQYVVCLKSSVIGTKIQTKKDTNW
jgi:hypothetical protein